MKWSHIRNTIIFLATSATFVVAMSLAGCHTQPASHRGPAPAVTTHVVAKPSASTDDTLIVRAAGTTDQQKLMCIAAYGPNGPWRNVYDKGEHGPLWDCLTSVASGDFDNDYSTLHYSKTGTITGG